MMSSSKEIILSRIENALGKKSERSRDNIERKYEQTSQLNETEKTELFSERVSEYRAITEQVSESEIAARIKAICENSNIKKLVLPAGINEDWVSKLPSSVLLRDDPKPLSREELNNSDAVITGCFLGIAQTGTIVLNAGAGHGRRVLTLLPDFHICVVKQDQIVGIFPEAIKKLDQSMKESGAPVTLISGPSATSDIELSRVEGVHGPRKLHVLIVKK